MVSDLMNIDGVSWNEDALDQNLLPVDAQAVHAMHPLGRVRRTFALGGRTSWLVYCAISLQDPSRK